MTKLKVLFLNIHVAIRFVGVGILCIHRGSGYCCVDIALVWRGIGILEMVGLQSSAKSLFEGVDER